MEEQKDSPWIARYGAVIWVSFLFASVATMLFFATFDPSKIASIATFPMELDRMAGYTIGFFLFWLLLVANAMFILWLTRGSNIK